VVDGVRHTANKGVLCTRDKKHGNLRANPVSGKAHDGFLDRLHGLRRHVQPEHREQRQQASRLRLRCLRDGAAQVTSPLSLRTALAICYVTLHLHLSSTHESDTEAPQRHTLADKYGHLTRSDSRRCRVSPG
jgi:hypothetical protein